MGQFALGIRSLLIKAAIFVVMAALLAWALGGTLWPRPEIARFDGVVFAGQRYFWQLAVGGKNTGEVRWRMMIEGDDGEVSPLDSRSWIEVSGPIATKDSLYFAGRTSFNPAEHWQIARVDRQHQETISPMPDRLAVEQQLERLANGLPLQDLQTIKSQRPAVLDPSKNLADK